MEPQLSRSEVIAKSKTLRTLSELGHISRHGEITRPKHPKHGGGHITPDLVSIRRKLDRKAKGNPKMKARLKRERAANRKAMGLRPRGPRR